VIDGTLTHPDCARVGSCAHNRLWAQAYHTGSVLLRGRGPGRRVCRRATRGAPGRRGLRTWTTCSGCDSWRGARACRQESGTRRPSRRQTTPRAAQGARAANDADHGEKPTGVTGGRTRTGAADKIRAGKSTGDGVPRITKLDDTSCLQWSTESEHLMRFKGCWPAVDPARVGTTNGGGPGTAATPLDGADAPSGAPSGSTTVAIGTAELQRLDEQAMSLMVLNVKPHHMPTFRRHRRQPCPPASGCHLLHLTASRALYTTSG